MTTSNTFVIDSIKFVDIAHFRNGEIKEFMHNFNEKCNAIVGPNGSGKTTILRILKYVIDILSGKKLNEEMEDCAKTWFKKEYPNIQISFKINDDIRRKIIASFLCTAIKHVDSYEYDFSKIIRQFNELNVIDVEMCKPPTIKINPLFKNIMLIYQHGISYDELNIERINKQNKSCVRDIQYYIRNMIENKTDCVPIDFSYLHKSKKWEYLLNKYEKQSYECNLITLIKEYERDITHLCEDTNDYFNKIEKSMCEYIFSKIYINIDEEYYFNDNNDISSYVNTDIGLNITRRKYMDNGNVCTIYMKKEGVSQYPLSCGENQVVEICDVIHDDKYDIVIYDEPLCNVDGSNIKKICTKFTQSNKQYIVTTHNQNFINTETLRTIMYVKNGNKYDIWSDEKDENDKISKILYEEPLLLFHDKFIFCEGYYDIWIIKSILNKFEWNECTLIDMHGSNTGMLKLCDKINIKYLAVHDLDKKFSDKKYQEFKNKVEYDNNFNDTLIILSEHLKTKFDEYNKKIQKIKCSVDIITFIKEPNAELSRQIYEELVKFYNEEEKCAMKQIEVCKEKYMDTMLKNMVPDIAEKISVCVTNLSRSINDELSRMIPDVKNIVKKCNKTYIDKINEIVNVKDDLSKHIPQIIFCQMFRKVLKGCRMLNYMNPGEFNFTKLEKIRDELDKKRITCEFNSAIPSKLVEQCNYPINDELKKINDIFEAFHDAINEYFSHDSGLVDNIKILLTRYIQIDMFINNENTKNVKHFWWSPMIYVIEGFEIYGPTTYSKTKHGFYDRYAVCEKIEHLEPNDELFTTIIDDFIEKYKQIFHQKVSI